MPCTVTLDPREPGAAVTDEPSALGPLEAPAASRRIRRRLALVVTALVVVSLVLPYVGPARTYPIVFEPGAAASLDPEIFAAIPNRQVGEVIWLELRRRDTLELRNLDQELHQVAGIVVRPGETVRHTFRERGTFSGECSLALTVFVEVAGGRGGILH
jgi:hypothetical protein